MKDYQKNPLARPLKTRIHTFNFLIGRGDEGEQWHQLKTRLDKEPGRGYTMEVLGLKNEFNVEPGEITLESDHLFENQWNSDKGRVFDFYIRVNPDNRLHKSGHYLEMTPEMVEMRQKVLKCGYTGEYYTEGKFNISERALSSPYLKESELHLLRLVPVAGEWKTTRKPLTEEERAYLLPLYIEAQTKRSRADAEKLKAKLREDYDKTCRIAKMEFEGMTWLLDRGVNTENVIFYNHTQKFSFGWRSPYPKAATSKLLDIISEFPFEYDIKGES